MRPYKAEELGFRGCGDKQMHKFASVCVIMALTFCDEFLQVVAH